MSNTEILKSNWNTISLYSNLTFPLSNPPLEQVGGFMTTLSNQLHRLETWSHSRLRCSLIVHTAWFHLQGPSSSHHCLHPGPYSVTATLHRHRHFLISDSSLLLHERSLKIHIYSHCSPFKNRLHVGSPHSSPDTGSLASPLLAFHSSHLLFLSLLKAIATSKNFKFLLKYQHL